jgi:uncharacterized protein HemY
MKRVIVFFLAIAVLFSFLKVVLATEQYSSDKRGSYHVYSQNLFQGKQQMKRGEFVRAQTYFVKALETLPLPEALAFAATASYKINDLKTAEGYLTEAEKKDTGSVNKIRIAGYKALVYLKEGMENEGMKALQEYSTLYSHLDPLINIQEVQAMIKRGSVDLQRLEALMDEQIAWHEDEIEQYEKTGTGFYGRYN